MPQDADAPPMKVPLGISPSIEPTIENLMRRARRRLRLMHSGQEKLEYLTDEQYLQGARLAIENDSFVLVLPMRDPDQGDLVGYPSPKGSPPNGGAANAAASDTAGRRATSGAEPPNQGVFGACAEDAPMSLDEALSALLVAGTIQEVSDDMQTVVSDTRGDAPAPLSTGSGTNTSAVNPLPSDLGAPSQTDANAKYLAPVEARQLVVDQNVKCIEASAELLSQVVKISQESKDVVGETRQLERRTRMDSAPARSFIAAREPEFTVDAAGHQIPFTATVVRSEMPGAETVRIKFQFDWTKAENDILRAGVIEAVGTGVPGGVCQLGSHDLRFVGLTDWQRGVLLIVRGTGQVLSMGVREGVSTARLERKPALVVDPGDWMELKRLATVALESAQLPTPAGAESTSPPEEKDEEAT